MIDFETLVTGMDSPKRFVVTRNQGLRMLHTYARNARILD